MRELHRQWSVQDGITGRQAVWDVRVPLFQSTADPDGREHDAVLPGPAAGAVCRNCRCRASAIRSCAFPDHYSQYVRECGAWGMRIVSGTPLIVEHIFCAGVRGTGDEKTYAGGVSDSVAQGAAVAAVVFCRWHTHHSCGHRADEEAFAVPVPRIRVVSHPQPQPGGCGRHDALPARGWQDRTSGDSRCRPSGCCSSITWDW